jgi:hypothetical protein
LARPIAFGLFGAGQMARAKFFESFNEGVEIVFRTKSRGEMSVDLSS